MAPALNKVAALQPRAVVAGHKNKDLPDAPGIINETRDYLLDAQRLLAGKPSPRQFFDQMIRLYPDRLNVGPVWYGAVALALLTQSDPVPRRNHDHRYRRSGPTSATNCSSAACCPARSPG